MFGFVKKAFKKVKGAVKKVAKTVTKPILHPVKTAKKITKGTIKTITHPVHALKRGAKAVGHAVTDPKKLLGAGLFVATGGASAIVSGSGAVAVGTAAGNAAILNNRKLRGKIKKIPVIGDIAKPVLDGIDKIETSLKHPGRIIKEGARIGGNNVLDRTGLRDAPKKYVTAPLVNSVNKKSSRFTGKTLASKGRKLIG